MIVTVVTENRRRAERLKWYAAFALAAFAAHLFFFLKFIPEDVLLFVGAWYRHILSEGRLDVFARPFGNYSPPYLYLLSAISLLDGAATLTNLIKGLSWCGGVWLLLAGWRLFGAVGKPQHYAIFLLGLPSVISNVSMLGQADTFWVAPCVLAVAAAIRRKLLWVCIWFGLAFAFKAQAIFLAPFVVHILYFERAPAWVWAGAPIMFLAAMSPAWLIGWPASDLATIYLRQSSWQPWGTTFLSNSASIWTFLSFSFAQVGWTYRWVGYLAAMVVFGAYFRFMPKVGGSKLIASAAISAAAIPWVLPGMHERFFMLADVLAAAFAIASPSKRSVVAACAIQIASAGPVFIWAFQWQPFEFFAPVIMALGVAILATEISASNATRVR